MPKSDIPIIGHRCDLLINWDLINAPLELPEPFLVDISEGREWTCPPGRRGGAAAPSVQFLLEDHDACQYIKKLQAVL